MDNLFLLLFLISIVALVIGLIKPNIFSFLQKQATRKSLAMIFGVSTIFFFVLFSVTTEPTTQTQPNSREDKVSENQEVNQKSTEEENKKLEIENQLKVENENVMAETVEKSGREVEILKEGSAIEVVKKDIPVVEEIKTTSKTDRDNVIAVLKINASSKWGNDYEMVQYEYNNQIEAYDWVVAQTKYSDIMTKARIKWGDDYEMVKYEYNNQKEAYEWIITQIEYSDIMDDAKQKWGNDYEMVQYEYNNQVEAYKNLFK